MKIRKNNGRPEARIREGEGAMRGHSARHLKGFDRFAGEGREVVAHACFESWTGVGLGGSTGN